jgi:uncharacterized peroxidase-related enzyme
MPHINFNNDFPGIRAALAYRPETAGPLGQLAQILLKDTTGISPAERELIATYVSYLNDCFYCHVSHGEIACIYMDGNRELIEQVKQNYQSADITEKLKSLLRIAGKVQQSGKAVTKEDIENARTLGATDLEIHDTVLIAAAFCMFNRYVDGLDTYAPTDLASYPLRAKQVVEFGYGDHVFSSPQPTDKKD